MLCLSQKSDNLLLLQRLRVLQEIQRFFWRYLLWFGSRVAKTYSMLALAKSKVYWLERKICLEKSFELPSSFNITSEATTMWGDIM